MAYLTAEVRRRPNLRILPDAFVEALLFEGRRATGVQRPPGRSTPSSFAARRSLSPPARLHSPAILQRAGVGPAKTFAAVWHRRRRRPSGCRRESAGSPVRFDWLLSAARSAPAAFAHSRPDAWAAIRFRHRRLRLLRHVLDRAEPHLLASSRPCARRHHRLRLQALFARPPPHRLRRPAYRSPDRVQSAVRSPRPCAVDAGGWHRRRGAGSSGRPRRCRGGFSRPLHAAHPGAQPPLRLERRAGDGGVGADGKLSGPAQMAAEKSRQPGA